MLKRGERFTNIAFGDAGTTQRRSVANAGCAARLDVNLPHQIMRFRDRHDAIAYVERGAFRRFARSSVASHPWGNIVRHSNRELTEFLRARRASLRPADVGLPETRRGGSLTQEHVAELIGVSRQWYVQFEAGDVREPTLSLLRRTAEALRLGPDDVETLRRLASREALPTIARREPRVVGDATYRAALVRGPVAIIVAGDRYSARLLDGETCGESVPASGVPLFLMCGRLTRPRSVAATTLGDAGTPVALIGVMSADERSDRGFDVAVLEAARAIIAEMTTRAG